MSARAKRRQCATIERWELKLAQDVAASFRTNDPAALESDLMLHLIDLKQQPPRTVADWHAYLYVALRNKAIELLRGRLREDPELVSLNMPLRSSTQEEDPGAMLEALLRSAERDPDSVIRIGRLLDDCDSWLTTVWRALLQTNGNVTDAAIRLRVHRHTIRAARTRIADIARRHGFGDRR